MLGPATPSLQPLGGAWLLASLLCESSASRLIFILEAESLGRAPRGCPALDLHSAPSMAAAMASVAQLFASSRVPAVSSLWILCSRTFHASKALISASVLTLSSGTFLPAALMASLCPLP